MTVKSIPEGYHSVTPYLSIKGAAKAIEFYKEAFGASVIFCMDTPNGLIGHAEITIGDSRIMLADPCEDMDMFRAPDLLGTTVCLHVYVENVDAQFAQAIQVGAKIVKAVEDQFYGDRSGTLQDPFGHMWCLATHKENLTPDEIVKRAEAFYQKNNA